MLSHEPDISGQRSRLLRNIGYGIFIRESGRGLLRLEQSLEFDVVEPDETQIVIGISQRLEFSPQGRFVPAGVESELVVRYHERALLRFGEMTQDYHGYHLHPEFLRGQDSRVPGQDFISLIHKNGICPAELPDRCRDLCDLLAAVCARVVDTRNQAFDQPALDLDVNV